MADIPSPVAFGFIFPSWLAYLSTGVLFLAIWLIESLALQLLVHPGWLKALKLTFLANLISSTIGFLLGVGYASGVYFLPFVILSLLIIALLWKSYNKPKTRGLSSLKSILIWFGIFILAFLFYFFGTNFPDVKFSVMLSLIPAFIVTVILEGFYLIPRLSRRLNFYRVAVINVASYVLLLILLISTGFHPYQAPSVSTDVFYYIIIPGQIKRGDIDGAMKNLDEVRKLYITPRYSFWHSTTEPLSWDKAEVSPWGEMQVARLLAQKGYYREALEVADWLKNRRHLWCEDIMQDDVENFYTELKNQIPAQENISVANNNTHLK